MAYGLFICAAVEIREQGNCVITARAIAAITLTVLVCMVILRSVTTGAEKIEQSATAFQPSAERLDSTSSVYKRGYDF